MKRVTRTNAGYVSVDTDTLTRIREDIQKNGKARVHVGILGGSAGRVGEGKAVKPSAVVAKGWDAASLEKAQREREANQGITNPELGAIHEFGVVDSNIPSRSFLRMPVIQELPAALKATNRDQWHKIIVTKGIKGALGILGAYALDVIHLAFDTGGFGAWQPLKPRTIKRKGSNAILIDTAQMRQAITAEVVIPK